MEMVLYFQAGQINMIELLNRSKASFFWTYFFTVLSVVAMKFDEE